MAQAAQFATPVGSSPGFAYQAVNLARTQGQHFRERVNFLFLFIIAFYVTMRIMAELKSILLPFMGAFFMVMVWQPVVDQIDRLIANFFEAVVTRLPLRCFCPLQGGEGWRHVRRLIGAIIVVGVMGLLLTLFSLVVLQSARRVVNEHWNVYQKGFQSLNTTLLIALDGVPSGVMEWMPEDIGDNMMKAVQPWLKGVVLDVMDNVHRGLFATLVAMLYLFFGLVFPVPAPQRVNDVVRAYVLKKTLASLVYGLAIGLWLYTLGVDLSPVFALTTFMLNFVPEVGPVIAMVLPCPFILFDSRIETPIWLLFVALMGQLTLKFVFGGLIEVKLIEGDQRLRLHPTIMLLTLGVFGHIWGPTGMLLSIPLVALVKLWIEEHAPPYYKEPFMLLLEGLEREPTHAALTPNPAFEAPFGRQQTEFGMLRQHTEGPMLRVGTDDMFQLWQDRGLQAHLPTHSHHLHSGLVPGATSPHKVHG